jgi:hypothetical protein
LNLAHRLLEIFVSSASQVMEVVHQIEDLGVHLHQLDQAHLLVFEFFPVAAIEKLFESLHDNSDLSVVKSVF